MKRKAPKSSPAPSGASLSLSADSPSLVDRSSPAAPWSFLSSYQAFIEIIQFFAKENIKYSDSTVAVPLVNTLRPLLRLRPSSSSASPRNGPSTSSPTLPPCPSPVRLLLRKHLKPRMADFQDMLWDYPDNLQELLDAAGIDLPTSDFRMPQVKLKTRTPLSLSKIDLDSESEEEPIVKKPRLDKPPVPGRAASVEGGAAAVSIAPQTAAGPSVTTPRALRSTATETPSKPSTSSTIKVKTPSKPEPKPAKVETKPEVKPSKPPPPTVSTTKAKGKGKDPEPYLTAEQKVFADQHPTPSTREELLIDVVYSETAPPGPWSQGLARPLPAQIRAPSVLVGDWLSPTLWSKSPCKCISCINRLLDCSDGDFGTRCVPCTKGGIKCSRTNTDEEDVVMQEALRPLQALSSDAFVRVLQRAVESRRIAEMHYRLFLRSLEDLNRANNHAVLTYVNAADMSTKEGMELFFEDPADKEHVEALCKQILSQTSLQTLQLAHLEANTTSGVRRRDESQPHSIVNTFHTPMPTAILARPIDPELEHAPADVFAGVPAVPIPALAASAPSSSSVPPVFGPPNDSLLPPSSAVTAPAADEPMPPPSA
ncbi:hypothetical protein B0H16DRAFT_1697349 [Mycena metata]|uniref:Uncharacterized protein n=1 Tax=Mycena metata TaxID=1033252 RepID=A0AAD7HUY3_9AGAR|nr:hypothetical protein B0H16DRAFT_1697349 [Mycena metata]